MTLLLLSLLATDLGIAARHLGVNDGLAVGRTWTMVQDQLGLIWIGSSYGVNIYDGRRFLHLKHDPADDETICGDMVRTLTVDGDGYVWAGTINGLSRIHPSTYKVRRYEYRPDSDQGLLNPFVRSLAADPVSNSLWVATSPGVSRLDLRNDTWRHYRLDELGLNPGPVRVVHLTPTGVLWVAGRYGLVRYNPTEDRFEHVLNGPAAQKLSQELIFSLSSRQDGGLWVGARGGLYGVDERGFARYFDLSPHMKDPSIFTTAVDSQGFVWLGSLRGGLIRFNPQDETADPYSWNLVGVPSFTQAEITALNVDRSGLLWVGVNDFGISMLDLQPKKFEVLTTSEGAITDVQTMYQDRQGWVWMNSDRTLWRFDFERGRSERIEQEFPESITAITGDDENLYIAFYAGGVYRYSLGGDVFRELGQGDETVFTLLKDRDGRLWRGGHGGLKVYDPDLNEFRDSNVGLETERIQVLFEDRTGRIWAGADQVGLFAKEPERATFNPLADQTDAIRGLRRINAIHEDDAGEVWIASMSGLFQWREDRRFLESHEMLRGKSVYAVVSDGASNLWLSTNRGVVNYRIRGDSPQLRIFDIADGLQGYDFHRGAGLALNDGLLLFGGPDGVNTFDPVDFRLNFFVPPVLIRSMSVYGDMRPLSPEIERVRLTTKEKQFELFFAALDYHDPTNHQFMVKLEPYDRDWRLTREPMVQYTNLPGGVYEFHVRGANDDGIWNEEGAKLKVIVEQPLFRRSSFQIFVALLLLGAVVGVHRWRVRDLKQRRRRLSALVEERTRELDMARQNLLGFARRSGVYEITHGVLNRISAQIADMRRVVREMLGQAEVFPLQHGEQLLAELQQGAQNGVADAELVVPADALKQLEQDCQDRRTAFEQQAMNVVHHVLHMSETIARQHKVVKSTDEVERVDLCDLIEDALQLEKSLATMEEIRIERFYRARPTLELPRIKMLHVLIQVIQNAMEAMSDASQKILAVRVEETADGVRIAVVDTGRGLPTSTSQDRMLSRDFNSKDDHQGIGLYSSAQTMGELGGTIELSPGAHGVGTMVILFLPNQVDRSSVSE